MWRSFMASDGPPSHDMARPTPAATLRATGSGTRPMAVPSPR